MLCGSGRASKVSQQDGDTNPRPQVARRLTYLDTVFAYIVWLVLISMHSRFSRSRARLVDKTYKSTNDDFAFIHRRGRADGAALGSGPGSLGVFLHSTNGGFGCSSLGRAAAAAVGTAALATRLGDVLERLVKLGRHGWRVVLVCEIRQMMKRGLRWEITLAGLFLAADSRRGWSRMRITRNDDKWQVCWIAFDGFGGR